jgi:hypothetical protein
MGRRLLRVVVGVAVVILVVVGLGVAALVIVDWRARSADEVRVVEVPFTWPGSSAVTTGRIIFIHRDRAEDSDLLAHELVHVCQWDEQGFEFLWNYSREYVENVVELRDLEAAYVEISFEREAALGDVDCDIEHYLLERD